MSLRKQVMINASSSWANTFVTALVGLILVPIMRAKLGDDYGIWALLAFGLAFPVLLDTSFALAVNRFVAFYRDQPQQMNRITTASFVVLGTLAIVTVAAAVLLSFFVDDIFAAIPDEMAEPARIACVLVGLTFAFKMLESTFSGVLQGSLYYTRYNTVIITGIILRAVLVVLLLNLHDSIVSAQLGFVIAAAFSAMLMYIVARKSVPTLRFDLGGLNKVTLKELFSHTTHSIGRSGGLVVMYNTMTLLVGWAGTRNDVFIYTTANKLPAFIRGILAGMQNVFLPAVTDLNAKGKLESAKKVLTKGTHINAVVTYAGCILLFIFAREILHFWLREPISDRMVLVMRIFIISILPRGFFGIWIPGLVGLGHLKWLSIISAAIAVAGICLTLVLMNISDITVAPAIAQVIVLWACWGLWLPMYGLYKTQIQPLDYFAKSLLSATVAAVVSFCSIWVLNSFVLKNHFHWAISLGLSMVVLTIIFAIISLRSEMMEISAIIKKRFSGRRNAG